MPYYLPNLSDQLKVYMSENNITKAELSRRTGIAPHQIKAMLAGGHTVYNIKHVMRLAELFGVTMQEILERGRGGEEPGR